MNWMITIEPYYVQVMKLGLKTMEVRKFIPRSMRKGDNVIVVEKGLHNKVSFMFTIQGIVSMPPDMFWRSYSGEICVKENDFFDYVAGKKLVYGIRISYIRYTKKDVKSSYFGVKAAPQGYARVFTNCDELAKIFDLYY